MTNSKQQLKEYFEEETSQKPSTSEIVQQLDPNSSVEEQIKVIYKKIYFTDIPQKDLDIYKAELNKDNFDAASFCRNLTLERTAEVQDLINDAFIKVLKRPATPQEMDKYQELYMSNKLKSPSDLVRILSNSPELVNDADKRKVEQTEGLKRNDYDLYKQIIDVYQKVLDRLPNAAELNHYFVMMKNDFSFTLSKLEDALLTSREYTILSMNQRNVVQGELMGNITERQVEIVVTNVYKSIYQKPPDKTTYNYIRSKFIDMNLDEEKLVLFIQDLKRAEIQSQKEITVSSTSLPKKNTEEFPKPVATSIHKPEPVNAPVPTSTSASTVTKTSTGTATGTNTGTSTGTATGTSTSVIENFIDARPDISGFVLQKYERFTEQDATKAAAATKTTTTTTTTSTSTSTNMKQPSNTNTPTETSTNKPSEADTDPQELKSFNVYQSKCCDYLANSIIDKAGKPNPESTEKIIERIKNDAKCSFDKNRLEKILELNDKQLYADYVNSRNMDLGCKAEKSKYLNANNNMVLYPEFKWSVPQTRPPVCYGKGNYYQPLVDQTALIGTLLSDANCTSVGSIMPEFTYEEKENKL
jgi:hypothetical protein